MSFSSSGSANASRLPHCSQMAWWWWSPEGSAGSKQAVPPTSRRWTSRSDGEDLERAVDGGQPGGAVAAGAQAVVDLLRAEAARLALEQREDLLARPAGAVAGPGELLPGVLAPAVVGMAASLTVTTVVQTRMVFSTVSAVQRLVPLLAACALARAPRPAAAATPRPRTAGCASSPPPARRPTSPARWEGSGSRSPACSRPTRTRTTTRSAPDDVKALADADLVDPLRRRGRRVARRRHRRERDRRAASSSSPTTSTCSTATRTGGRTRATRSRPSPRSRPGSPARTRRHAAGVRPRRRSATPPTLERLDREVARCIGEIPAAQRTLVTTHDALGSYAARYGLRVVGTVIPSRSTLAQPSAGEVDELIATIRREGVRAIFAESSVNPRRRAGDRATPRAPASAPRCTPTRSAPRAPRAPTTSARSPPTPPPSSTASPAAPGTCRPAP